ncbi:CDP-alcohol phosphatidyltransferase family protein [Thiohalorhabdus methylotrophus]|uniref:CDP-alcohol phosphatidyltransferase family protein n=1 Tax=Thiohalorhabdus methylotrophus TaxID=3242694 RepID=A0ABV4TSM9_9GAMM
MPRPSPVERIREAGKAGLERLLGPLVRALARSPVTPNQVTAACLLLTLAAAGALAAGHLATAGALFLVGSAFDLLDGTLARASGRTTPFGAFLDSTLDRLGEGALLAAAAYRFALEGQALAVAVVALGLLGALLTSYTRARAEGLGLACTVGWLSRPERVGLLGIGLLFNVLAEAVFLLAVLSLWTVGQRILHVRRQTGGGPPDLPSSRDA